MLNAASCGYSTLQRGPLQTPPQTPRGTEALQRQRRQSPVCLLQPCPTSLHAAAWSCAPPPLWSCAAFHACQCAFLHLAAQLVWRASARQLSGFPFSSSATCG
eukprot:1393891-Pleurochrysis_carterae.AAC.1